MYHFALNDGVAVFATHTVTKEIEMEGRKEIVTIPVFSREEAEAAGGLEITEQHVPDAILERAAALAGKTSSKENFEKMLYADGVPTTEQRVAALEGALLAVMIGGRVYA